ncbi:hypothetical protein PYW07_004854 [Mythimna separata]|uniref:RNase H type-1 domain-containing protein n=1 Tax=Mythimna separata TaxID=271217 RepID=A0AAD7YWH0_MYTSE|nr:hypothetical protein PYW07_004854 [Mythimna separata]
MTTEETDVGAANPLIKPDRAGPSPKKPTQTPSVRRSIGEWENSRGDGVKTATSTTFTVSPNKLAAPLRANLRTTLPSERVDKRRGSVEAAGGSPRLTKEVNRTPSDRVKEGRLWLQRAKTHLGESRNLRSDIKAGITLAVETLYQIIKDGATEMGPEVRNHNSSRPVTEDKGTQIGEMEERGAIMAKEDGEDLKRMLREQGEKIDQTQREMVSLRDTIASQAASQAHTYASVAAAQPRRHAAERSALHSIVITSKDESHTGDQRSKLATDELHLTAQAKGISVALVQEPYVGRTGVMKQSPGTQVIQCSLNRQKPVKAAIVIFGSSLEVIHDPQLVTENIVAVLLKVGQLSIGVLSVYFEGDQELHPYLSALQHTTHKLHTNNILVGGDVNAWSQWWGSVSENHRGAEYCSFLHEQDFQILNSGQTPTFEIYRGDRWCTSIVDVTACSLSLLGKMEEWRVERGLTSSDHNAITFSMRLEKALEPLRPVSTRIYNTRKAKWSDFGSHLKANLHEKQITKVRISNALGPEDLENILEEYTNAIHRSCDEAIPKLGSPRYSAKPPWWNSTLDLLKKDAVRKKRRIRNAAAHRREYTIEIYVTAKNKYTLAATEAATASWREFCTRQDRESMWDGIYRVLRKTARRQENTLLRNTAAQLITTEYARLEDWTPETLETHRVTGPQIYTDGSKIEGKVGAALTWWEGGKESMSSTFGLEPHNTVFQSEMYALFRAVRLAKESRAASISILSDSRSSLDLLKRPSVTHHLALQIKSCLSEIREEGRKVRLFWLKAHVGTAGNERADELAKQAALTKETADYDKVPVSYVRRKIREGTVKKWQARYESSSTGAVTKVFFPDVLAAKRILRDTVLTPAHTQILTGHGGFAAYLHRFHLKNSPSCVCDQSCEETVWHLLFECPSGAHDGRDCKNRAEGKEPTCINCKGAQKKGSDLAHTAFSEDCQERQKWDGIARSRRSKLATDELHLTAQAKGISVALVQEPYVGRTGVMKQSPGTQVIQCSLNRQKPVKAAIVIFGSSLEVIHDPQLVTENIVAVLLKVGQLSIGVLSVYFEGDQELHPYLSALQHTTHKLHTNNILVGGDVNAWSQWWGSVSENHRGAEYCSFLHEQDFQILNSGQTPTFEIYRGDRWCTSIVDVTACSLSLLGKMEEWRVERGLTSSDHNAITFSMRLEKALEPLRPVSTRIYNTRKAKWSDFSSHLKANLTEKEITKVRISNALGPEDLENILEEYTNAIHRSCDEAIPKLGSPKYSAKPPWWNSTLDLLKKDAVRKKRRIRNAAAHRREYTIEIYVTAKNKYTLAATEAATASWREFCTRQDRESMWDGIYRVLRKTARRQENTLLRNTAAQLITTEYARLEDWTPETLETHRVTGPQIYTDGSKIEGKVGAALTWWEGGKESMSSTFGLEPHNTVFQSEMYALFRAVRLAKESRAASISILSDSRSSLDLLKRPSVTHHLALQIKSCLSEIREEGRKVRLFWLKAHVGTAGNERADELAKQAALTKETADYDKVPVSYVRRKIREGTVKKWQARTRRLRSISPPLPSQEQSLVRLRPELRGNSLAPALRMPKVLP